MSEQNRPTPTDLHRLKDAILENWEQLPAEHQATMILVLFNQVLEGEQSAWLAEAVSLSLERTGQ